MQVMAVQKLRMIVRAHEQRSDRVGVKARIPRECLSCILVHSDIQEEILFLPRVERGRDPIREHTVRPIAATLRWCQQRRLWVAVRDSATSRQVTSARAPTWSSMST